MEVSPVHLKRLETPMLNVAYRAPAKSYLAHGRGVMQPPEKIAGGYRATAGPVFSRRGYLLFSDVPSNRILKWERGESSPAACVPWEESGS